MIQYAPFARNAKMRIKEVEEEDEQWRPRECKGRKSFKWYF
jgi:hypothetical protein